MINSNIKISNPKSEESIASLVPLAQEYANYFNSCGEEWTCDRVIKMFKENFYNRNKDLFFVAYDENKPVGVVMFNLDYWDKGASLTRGEFFVTEDYREQGIGTQLLKTLLDYAIEKYKVVGIEGSSYRNEIYGWYKKIGFEDVCDPVTICGSAQKILQNLKNECGILKMYER